MPIVPIAIALAIVVALLVAAVGPALRIAERRRHDGEADGIDFVPLERQVAARRVAARRVAARRFVPTPADARTAERVPTGRRGV